MSLKYSTSLKYKFNELAAFKRDLMALFKGQRKGHMGQYQYSKQDHENDPVQGAKLREQFLKSSKDYYIKKDEQRLINNKSKDLGAQDVVIDLGCGPEESVRDKVFGVLEQTKAQRYVPVDLSVDYLKSAAAAVLCKFMNIDVDTVHTDFNTGKPVLSFKAKAGEKSRVLSLMFGATAMNIEADPEQGFPIERFKENMAAVRDLVDGQGKMVITYDSCLDVKKVYKSYAHDLQRKFGANLMHRIERDFNTKGFDPAQWEYEPVIHEHDDCLIVAHTVIPKKNMRFEVDGHKFTVKKGQQFVLNTSIKVNSDFVTKALNEIGISTEKVYSTADKTATWHMLSFD